MFEPIESRKFLGKKANTRSDEGGERNRRRQRMGTWNLELDVVEERKKKKEERGVHSIFSLFLLRSLGKAGVCFFNN